MKRLVELSAVTLGLLCCVSLCHPLDAAEQAATSPEAASDADDKPGEVEEQTKPSPVTEAELGSTRPVHRAGNVLLAGQPDRDDFETLARSGYATVITLRAPDENQWNEQQVVEAAGMKFVELPIRGPDDLNDRLFKRARDLLRAAEPDRKVCLHCASSNRVGAVWMAYRVLDEGVSLEQAHQEAEQVGLRSRELRDKAVDYIERSRDR